MITIQQITTTDEDLYAFTERLLVDSFPKEEYRELALQREITDTSYQFSVNIVLDNEKPAGFISLWNLGFFIYIEHFAIDPSQRNKGFGSDVIHKVKALFTLPLVLEAEPPTDDTTRRRIAFYKRNGFQLWAKNYLQPPYRKGYDYLPLKLMATPELDPDYDYEKVKTEIYRVVYRVDD